MPPLSPPTDLQLLADFVDRESHAAFESLVHRHASWVFAAALRQLHDRQLAEDATQTVFLLLFQKAPAMRTHEKLSGWLFNTLHYAVQNIRRALRRREYHERRAAPPPQTAASAPAPDLALHLDAAVHRLSASDRTAILLRFYQDLSYPQIAATLNLSEAAAKKRVTRAVDRLRRKLKSPADSNALAAAVSTSAAPPTLAHSITHAALIVNSGALPAATLTAMKGTALLMATAKIKTAIIVTIAALLVAAPVVVLTVEHMTAPSAPVIAAAPPSEPAAPPADFNQIYGLAPGQLIKRIPNPPLDIRNAAMQQKFRRQLPKNTSLFLVWGDAGMLGFSTRTAADGQYPLSELITRTFGIGSFEAEGDMLAARINGDFVYRQAATPEQYCAAMQAFLKQEFNIDASLQFRQVSRPVIIFRGTWRFTPIADLPPSIPPNSPLASTLLVYGNRKPLATSGGGSGDARSLARALGSWINQQVFIEADGLPDNIPYRTFMGPAGDEPAVDHDKNAVLTHIAQQTGLTWTEEPHDVRRLFIDSPPAPETAPAETPFQQAYGLAPGVALRHIALPFPDVRMEYYRTFEPRQAQVIPRGPDSMIIGWQKGKSRTWSMTFSNGRGGYEPLALFFYALDLYPQEIEGADILGNAPLPGDFALDLDASQEQRRADLQAILSQILHKPVTLTFRTVERNVTVLAGKWQRKDIDGKPVENPAAGTIELYGEQLAAPIVRPNGGVIRGVSGSAPVPSFAKAVGAWIRKSVVIEADGAPVIDPVSWHENDIINQGPEARAKGHDPALVLQHITEQTGLTPSEQRRTVRRLIIEESPPR